MEKTLKKQPQVKAVPLTPMQEHEQHPYYSGEKKLNSEATSDPLAVGSFLLLIAIIAIAAITQ